MHKVLQHTQQMKVANVDCNVENLVGMYKLTTSEWEKKWLNLEA